jgi:single-strand DNA-binding protein
MNRVFLIGNLTKDPEVNVVSNDLTNCKFSIAVTRRYGKNETDYFSVVCWRGMAENCGRYLRKGSKVGVIGSIQNKNYETADGVKRYSVEIVADEVQFLSTRAETEANEAAESAASAQAAAPQVAARQAKSSKISDLKPVEGDEDLPF